MSNARIITNNHRRIIAAVRSLRVVPDVLGIVRALYPGTKQPMKKCKTFRRKLDALVAAGHLREISGRYYVTGTSRAAHAAPLGTPLDRVGLPVMMRILSDEVVASPPPSQWRTLRL